MSSLFDRVADRMSPPPGTGSPAAHEAALDVAAQFADIARKIQQDRTVEDVLQQIVELAVQSIDWVEHAAITVVRRRQFTTAAATGGLPARIDALQIALGEGPCLDSMRNHESYRTGDLATEARWPQFGPRVVAETGVRSMLSFLLFTDQHTHGALNLFSTRPDAFTDHSTQIAAIFATHAGLAIERAKTNEQVDQLQQALTSNREIAMAMGIIIAHRHCTEDEAFALLRQASQQLNRKLSEVANDMLRTGQTPRSAEPDPVYRRSTDGRFPSSRRADRRP